MQWEYNPSNYTGNDFQLIPPGDHRVRIESAEETVSKSSGKPMITLTLKVSGYNSKLWHFIVFDSSTQEARARTDNNLGQIFDSFAIAPGNLNFQDWVGKVGAARIKHTPDNRDPEKMQARISWFISRDKQEGLASWRENASKGAINPEMVNPDDDGPIPF